MPSQPPLPPPDASELVVGAPPPSAVDLVAGPPPSTQLGAPATMPWIGADPGVPFPGPAPVPVVPGRARPWWGIGDVLLGVPAILLAALIGSIIGLIVDVAAGGSLEDTLDSTSGGAVAPSALLVFGLLAQQAGQGVWPIIVSKWKGLGVVADWRLQFHWSDIFIGLGAALVAGGLAALAAFGAEALVDLADQSEADNTQFLRDAQDTLWFWPLIAAVVIGAPLTEELFFRGLCLRAFEKRGGPILAVIGSTLLFTLPHFAGGTVAGTVVLFAAIGSVGLVLAVVTLLVGRLWPAIFAHVVFNAMGVLQAIGAFGETAPT
ncbi:MAG: CPBP family intramembrane glutamic endopeptidase [Actinomycetota bacterium]